MHGLVGWFRMGHEKIGDDLVLFQLGYMQDPDRVAIASTTTQGGCHLFSEKKQKKEWKGNAESVKKPPYFTHATGIPEALNIIFDGRINPSPQGDK